MPGTTDRLDFGPPRDAGSMRAFGLALLVHVLLIAALTWGVNWKRSDQTVSFEAELWSSVPKEAAPKLVETAPTPPPPPPLPPTPSPPAPPAPAPPEVKMAPPLPDVDIAMEQEKKRKLLQQQKEAEAQKALKAEKAVDKLKAELQAKKEKEKEKAQQAKEQLAKRKAAEEAKKVAAVEAKKQEAKDQEKQKLAAAAAAAERLRQDALKRMMGLAGATGSADAKGSAQKSSGPSAGYPGKVRAAVRPNVVFTDDIAGNPIAEIEVRTTLDGTIISQRLHKSSGNKAWDDAAIKAVIRTGTLPRDVDGRVPTPMILEIRPKD